MPLTPPNLDDRDMQQLVSAAVRHIQTVCPQWTDLSPGDPGIVLLEAFAHVTETMLYRLNRLPHKAYIEFLNLLGVQLLPPTTAMVMLRFSRNRADGTELVIPSGTRVTTARTGGIAEPPIFLTSERVVIEADRTEVEVLAHHCELVEAELAGHGTGLPGLSVQAMQPPIVAATGANLDLIVAVEALPGELDELAPSIQLGDKQYRMWREVENFSNLSLDRFAYLVNRLTGNISFAPAVQMLQADGQLQEQPEALAEVPPAGREIRLWYRRGGGADGNLPAHTLTVLRDPIARVEVTNPEPATGGRDAESLENALQRGPEALRSLERVVTAEDYELIARISSGAVARAKAFTQRQLWQHAVPGTVEVVLVPNVPESLREREPLREELLETYQTDDALTHVQQELNDRQPLGTMCEARWVRYKRVRVKARVVAYREERPETIRARVLERLYQSINPLPAGPEEPGWNFGQELHASHVYDISLTAPGVNRVEQVSLIVDEAPSEAVGAIAADRFQPGTWYAGSHNTLFRSVNNGAGWEAVGRFPEGKIAVIRVSTEQAGLVAAVTTESVDRVTFRSQLHLSWDSGESWETPLPFGFRIRDVAWLLGASSPTLLLATDVGLFEVVMRDMERNPLQVLVASEDPSLGFYAVASARDAAGQIHLVVAAQKARGVYLCIEGAGARTFEHSGLAREDVRVLMVEYQGPRAILWAGLYSAGADEGTGCYRRELRSLESVQDTWHAYSTNWEGGSCRSLALLGSTVVAGTHRAGVRWLEGDRWQPEQLNLESGLPLRGREYLFYPIDALASDTRGQFLLSGGPRGVFRSLDAGETYENCSRHEYTDKVALPQTYLFCSGEHEIEVVSEDEAY